MPVLYLSLLVVVAVVLLCELLRALCRARLQAGVQQELALEVVCTLQLCCCIREAVLLGTAGGLEPSLCLTITYLLTVLHCLTSAPAVCNPCGSLHRWLRMEESALLTSLRLCAQFLAAGLSRLLMPVVWSLELSPLHGRQAASCISGPLRTSVLPGAGVELLCALCLYVLLHYLHRVKPVYQPHLVALLITTLVYLGGHLTGAVFNPALAFSVLFHCEGNTFSEYAVVYWAGPVIGMILSVFLFDRCIPRFKGPIRGQDVKTKKLNSIRGQDGKTKKLN
ncbi:aquaporin-11 [Rhinophrynus dorsalis]